MDWAGRWVGVRAGDVLLTRAAEPFRAAAVPSGIPSELAASSEISIIRPQPAVRPEYLAAVLCTPTLNRLLRDVAYRGRSAALPRFRLSDIGQLPVPLPTRSLQDSLALQYQQAVRLTAEARTEITTVAAAVHAEIDHRVSRIHDAQPRYRNSALIPPGALGRPVQSRPATPGVSDVIVSDAALVSTGEAGHVESARPSR